MDHSKLDMFLFRKEPNVPIFSITTQGSFFAVDLFPDGTLCGLTGKAVHAREFGSGGLLYNVDSNPGGGSILITITSEGSGEAIANANVEVDGIDDYYAFTDDEGAYEIKYIPVGNYEATASKVSHYPGLVLDVQVLEGQMENVDFILEETGNAPELTFVSHGVSIESVGLERFGESSGEGFNIYRKTIAEALFPNEPPVTIGTGNMNYTDTDVLTLKTYYYTVTQIIEEGVESRYSKTEEGWIASGFIIDNISIYYGSTPTIDGIISAGKQDDAFEMDASDFLRTYDNMPNPTGSLMMYYKVNEDMTELYVACINENDVVLKDHDKVALYIDYNNDGSFSPAEDNSEGNYWAAYYAAGNQLKYR